MQPNRIFQPALAAAAFLAGCTEQNAPTESGVADTQAEIGKASPAFARHGEQGQILLEMFPFADPDAGLAVVLGSADAFPICGESFEEVRLLDIRFIGSRPDPEVNDPLVGGRLVQALAKGEIFATVYAWAGEALDCDFILNGKVVAEGTVRAVLTDNDWNAALRTEPIRADAFGVSVHGMVTLASGDPARLNATYRAVFFPPDQVKEAATVRLMPIH